MTVNRVETCPTLIRTFYQKDEHHSIAEYVSTFPSPEVYVYTWADATLREVAYTILRSVKLPDVKTMSFSMVMPDCEHGGWKMEHVADVDLDQEEPDKRTLDSFGFKPGYFFDIAYTTE